MSSVFRKPMQLERRSVGVDAAGRPNESFSVAVTIYGSTRHRLDDRANDGGVITEQEQMVYVLPGADIEPGDRITFDGKTWTVVGEPFQAYSHRSRSVHHEEIRVRWSAR